MNLSDQNRNANMLRGPLRKRGYCRWWHSFTGISQSTGDSRTFFVEFFIINPALGGDVPILGQHPFYKKRGLKPSYVCIKAGSFPTATEPGCQLSDYYSVSELQYTSAPLVMQVGNCFYSEERIQGGLTVTEQMARHKSLMTNAGEMSWDLEVYKAVACHTGHLAGALSEAVNALDSYWHGEGIKTFFKGTVTWNGERYEVSPENSWGYCDKHWGRNYNRPWLQFSSPRLFSQKTGRELKHSALAITGCCPRFLFIPLRKKLLLQLTYMGEDFEFGMKPFVLSSCQWETKETNKRYIWHILARNKNAIIKISGSCTKEMMFALKYENPDGQVSPIPLLAGAGGIGTIELFRRTREGREPIDTLKMEHCFCEYRP